MKIYGSPQYHLEVLNNFDDQGIIKWTENKTWFERQQDETDEEENSSKKRKIKVDEKHSEQVKVANYMFAISKFYLDRNTYTTKKLVASINPKVEIVGEHATFSANAAPLFGFPVESGIEGLKALKSFFLQMKEIFGWYYEESIKRGEKLEGIYMVIYNSMEKTFIQHFNIKCNKESSLYPELLEKEQALRETIASNPYLVTWMKQSIKLLNKIGTHSWMTFGDDDFYETNQSPLAQARFAEYTEQAKKKKASI